MAPLKLSNTFESEKERNLCFVNSPLQALAAIPFFGNYFLSVDPSPLESKPVSREVARLLSSRGNSIISTSHLRSVVGHAVGKQYGGQQEDSHEFLVYLLEALEMEGHSLTDRFKGGEEKVIRKFQTQNGKCPYCNWFP